MTTASEYVAPRFRRAVALHLFKNLNPRPDRHAALLLGVHGPAGEGKTYQCARVFAEIGAHVEYVSGGELESREAGEPAEMVRRAYERASNVRRSPSGVAAPAVVFVNDIDAAIGDWGPQVQYTVNRQNVIGELMHLADFPQTVRNAPVSRIPVVLTGNDFTKLYGPLVRFGRMTLFNWTPDKREKLSVLQGLYPELSPAEAAVLLDEFPDQPTAFFANLRAAVHDDVLWRHMETVGVPQVFADLARGRVPRPGPVTGLDDLLRVARGLVESKVIHSHLQER